MTIPPQFDTPEFRQALIEFTTMRKKIRKPATDHAMSLILSKLVMWCGDDVAKAIAILNQSIERSWQGVFELKADVKKPEVPKVYNGADEGQTWTHEEFSKHIADLIRAIQKPDEDEVPF